jgi:hypothetical protein
MRRWQVWLLVSLGTVVLAVLVWMGAMFAWRALYVWTFTQAVRAVPTMGPVQDGSGGRGGTGSSIAAHTNCVEVGETLEITARFANYSDQPFTITGEPPLDIVIQAYSGPSPRPSVRWSDTAQYPQPFDPVFAPGEERQYVWRWQVEPAFAQQARGHSALQITLERGVLLEAGGISPAGVSSRILVGLGEVQLPGGGSVPCAELRR